MFRFSERAGRRVSITHVPASKQVILGYKEVEEMIFQLSDGSNDQCDGRDSFGSANSAWAGSLSVGMYGKSAATPAAVWRMFAYRACHSAVRIGMDLKKSHMRRIVDHMAEMDHPWVSVHLCSSHPESDLIFSPFFLFLNRIVHTVVLPSAILSTWTC